MRSRIATVAPSRDYGLDIYAGQGVANRVAVIAFIRKQSVDPVSDHAYQRAEALRIVRLARRQDEGERATSDIAAGVEFGGKAAARSAKRLGLASPSHGSSQVKRLCGRACSLFPSAQSYLFYLAGSAASRSNEPKQRACNSA